MLELLSNYALFAAKTITVVIVMTIPFLFSYLDVKIIGKDKNRPSLSDMLMRK